jgi:hypothetical protein
MKRSESHIYFTLTSRTPFLKTLRYDMLAIPYRSDLYQSFETSFWLCGKVARTGNATSRKHENKTIAFHVGHT